MIVIIVSNTDIASNEFNTQLAEAGIEIIPVTAGFFSSFTAIDIARAVNVSNARIVEVDCRKNAWAAISALKIIKTDPFKIVYVFRPDGDLNSDLSVSDFLKLDKDIAAWVFPSEMSAAKYPASKAAKVIIPPTDFSIFKSKGLHSKKLSDEKPDVEKPDVENRDEYHSSPVFVILPPLTNIPAIHAAIVAVDKLENDARLRICGTGKARFIMPEVRFSRYIDHPERVEWVGESYIASEEIEKATAGVTLSSDFSTNEFLFIESAKPVITPENISNYPDLTINYNPEDFLPDNHIARRCALYISL